MINANEQTRETFLCGVNALHANKSQNQDSKSHNHLQNTGRQQYPKQLLLNLSNKGQCDYTVDIDNWGSELQSNKMVREISPLC
jgi:hypothetical protein